MAHLYDELEPKSNDNDEMSLSESSRQGDVMTADENMSLGEEEDDEESESSSSGESSDHEQNDYGSFEEAIDEEVLPDDEEIWSEGGSPLDGSNYSDDPHPGGIPAAPHQLEDELIEYDTDESDDIDDCPPEDYLHYDPTPDKPYPRPNWFSINELNRRRFGLPNSNLTSQIKPSNFQRHASNSLWMIQRLELTNRLEGHTGSVNSLDFNARGNIICSGSDDLNICLWDWRSKGKKILKRINSGHTDNVLHSQFCNNDTNIVTSSRDGSIRLLDIEKAVSRQLLHQSGDIEELDFIGPETFVSCGTNANVNLVDLRMRDIVRLLLVRHPKNNRVCPLHTISSHPVDRQKISVAGNSPYVYIYDLRRIFRNPDDLDRKPTYCISNLEDSPHIVTSTAFNSVGDKLLVSYNDDDLFVCKTDTLEVVHRYSGHRNKKTIKGCAWFGDQYVLSGSDCGHIFGWDLESEHIVCFLEADIKGIVNTLKVHPELPILASSGFDHNVKVWEPTSKTWPQTLKGIKPVICKNMMHRKRSNLDS